MMRALSPAVAHARALLGVFGAELSPVLEALVQRLGRAVGSFADRSVQGKQEPDGYAGLGREVNYERLLLSEWLVAEEIPDEFMRRASMGEHSFLSLARTTPHATHHCLVGVDAGPGTLGAPRLASLALLIALERRALVASIGFEWFVLGDAAITHQETLSSHALHTFSEARSAREPVEVEFLERLAARGPASERSGERVELWILGSPRTIRWGRLHANVASITEPVSPPDCIQVSLEQRRSVPRSLSVPMPSAPLSVRLLKELTAPAPLSASAPSVSLERYPFFSGRGHRIIARDGADDLRAYPIPSHQGAAPGQAKRFNVAADERLLGCTYTYGSSDRDHGGQHTRAYLWPARETLPENSRW